MGKDIFRYLDGPRERENERTFHARSGAFVSRLPALEEAVAEWIKDRPVVWNVGMGRPAGGSFVRTLSRLLLERTVDFSGPHDHIIRVNLPPEAGSGTAHYSLAFEVLVEMARTLAQPDVDDDEVQELRQLAAEESYFGYVTFSDDDLKLRAFGPYIDYGCYPPLLERITKAFQGKRYLLVIENLHVPTTLDMLLCINGGRFPSPLRNPWLISATSRDVCDKSRRATEDLRGDSILSFRSSPEYFHAPNLDSLLRRDWDWSELLREALQDAAGAIHSALKHQQLQAGHDHHQDHWLRVAQQCLFYGVLYHPLRQGTAATSAAHATMSSDDELVRCWVAEDLILPTTTTSPTAGKNNNYYRSSFEAGKVVIRAMQEYSLLPIFSASSSASEDDAATITGVAKLAEGVPRLAQDQPINHLMRWVSFLNDDGRHINISWDWYGDWHSRRPQLVQGEMNLTTLVLRGCTNISGFPFHKMFNTILRVLDLSCTPITSLPPGFSRLLNLQLLSLRGCSKLETLCPLSSSATSDDQQPNKHPLSHIENLQVLDMNGVPLLEITQQDGSNKSNLHFLDLSGSRLTALPSDFFSEMPCLEELILGICSNLKELPPSLAKLTNLLILHVEGTQIASFPEGTFEEMQKLHTLKLINNLLLISLPMSISLAKGLKELHISNCISIKLEPLLELLSFLEELHIQTWKTMEDIKIQGHPNLRTFSVSGPWIKGLSLRGCSKLKFANFSDDLTALEEVDLSGTALEEVPHNLPNLPRLRMLLLLDVPCFKRFPWHQLVRLPRVFYLDHSANDNIQVCNMFRHQDICADETQQEEKTTNTAQIHINDPKMFLSFNADAAKKLVKQGKFLQSFNVQVKSCSVGGNKTQKRTGDICDDIQRQPPYLDVDSSKVSSIAPMKKLRPTERHVEISSRNRYTHGLKHLLSVTESIFITDDSSIGCCTDLNNVMKCIEECQLIQCHEMNVVFKMDSKNPEALSSLKILLVSNLNKLRSLVEPSDLSSSSLISLENLKHIHLEHCPRLEKLFPCSLSLPALETLVILFCSNLKTVFYKQPDYEVASSPLPKIERVYLQELPQLQDIRADVGFQFETPNWEKLFVRGCPSFQRLPLLKKKEFLKPKVEVSGERDWWGKLQWNLPEQRERYLHLPPPKFTSCKKHIIQSYLR